MKNVDIKFNQDLSKFRKVNALWVHISENANINVMEHASLKWFMIPLESKKKPSNDDVSMAVKKAIECSGIELKAGLNFYVADREMMNPLTLKELDKLVTVQYTATECQD